MIKARVYSPQEITSEKVMEMYHALGVKMPGAGKTLGAEYSDSERQVCRLDDIYEIENMLTPCQNCVILRMLTWCQNKKRSCDRKNLILNLTWRQKIVNCLLC